MEKDSKDYVLNHEYGYGQDPEQEELNRITLRNFEDLNVYVDQNINILFNALIKGRIICFFNDDPIEKVIVERI